MNLGYKFSQLNVTRVIGISIGTELSVALLAPNRLAPVFIITQSQAVFQTFAGHQTILACPKTSIGCNWYIWIIFSDQRNLKLYGFEKSK